MRLARYINQKNPTHTQQPILGLAINCYAEDWISTTDAETIRTVIEKAALPIAFGE
jgi:hypothetical protein